MKAGIWMALGAALMLASTAHAVGKKVFKCEQTDAKEIGKFGASRGKCISKCVKAKVKKPSLVCTGDGSGGGFDSKTQACADKARNKYKAKVAKKCAGLLPNCGSYAPFAPNDVAGYTDANVAQQAGLIDPFTEPMLMCDTSTKAALKCEQTVVKELSKYSGSLIKCLTKCLMAKQLKGAAIDCDPNDASPPLDSKTAQCMSKARTKSEGKINKKCGTLPACPGYAGGVNGLLDIVESNINSNYAAGSPNHPFCASPSGAFLEPTGALF